jgi:hypothetical protein
MDREVRLFTSVSKVDNRKLIVTFDGAIRIDHPYNHLKSYLNELETLLPKQQIETIEFDFQELKFCNSDGFYIIMDIIDIIIDRIKGSILVKRIIEDDWQQESLPILLNVDEPEIGNRITFEEYLGL